MLSFLSGSEGLNLDLHARKTLLTHHLPRLHVLSFTLFLYLSAEPLRKIGVGFLRTCTYDIGEVRITTDI